MTESVDKPLWSPSKIERDQCQMTAFAKALEQKYDDTFFVEYSDLWEWSVENAAEFWSFFMKWAGVIADRGEGPVIIDEYLMKGAQFFPTTQLNYAENLLRRSDNSVAIVFQAENQPERTLTWQELNQQVSSVQQFLKSQGVGIGDHIAGFVANTPETIIAALATASLGAVWSSASPDFGVQGILDRFGQIAPKIFFTSDGYFYNGKTISIMDKVEAIVASLPSVQATVILPLIGSNIDLQTFESRQQPIFNYKDVLVTYPPQALEFTRVPFNSPLYIMFSSGTTGVPKCIVHGVGGTLIQHLKEHKLHCDIRPGDRVFYFTTCSWMMWNWLISALASEATLMLYEGSPFYPNANVLWDYADRWSCSLFGTSAKYIDACRKADIHPGKEFKLEHLKMITSTGSPLSTEGFDYVYEAIKSTVHLASISGGTDIVSCFMLGNPWSPVWRGEIQGPGLGLAIDCFNDKGRSVEEIGEHGELVCTQPFPCMPIGFFNDPEGEKYRAAYFERFNNVWCHGDFIEITEHQGIIILGRSDATLKPGGVRIGTAEIYREVEKLDEVIESIAIGQQWDNDIRIVLF
ncbi:MAG: acetoacetate--CoA ligase, partial [Pseudomonadota bacterium]